jgi:hypothetical protein
MLTKWLSFAEMQMDVPSALERIAAIQRSAFMAARSHQLFSRALDSKIESLLEAAAQLSTG